LAEFHKAEESSARRKVSLKIGAPFERALDTILKVNQPSAHTSSTPLKNGKKRISVDTSGSD